MKVDLYTLFNSFDDECIDILEKSNYGKNMRIQYSSEITKRMVRKRVEQQEKINIELNRRNISIRKLFLIAIIAALLLSALAVAKNYWDFWEQGGAEKITDENRSLVGKEIQRSDTPIKSDRALYSIDENEIIKSAEKDAHIPRTVDIFSTKTQNELFVTPEIITTNDSMALFTSSDKKGWKLKKGETLSYNVGMYDNETVEKQHLIICLIINGELQKKYTVYNDKNIKYKTTATEDGYYNIGVVNASSDTISLKEGFICVE